MHDFYLLGDHITPPVPLVLPAAGMYVHMYVTYEIVFPCLSACMHTNYIICTYKTAGNYSTMYMNHCDRDICPCT